MSWFSFLQLFKADIMEILKDIVISLSTVSFVWATRLATEVKLT